MFGRRTLLAESRGLAVEPFTTRRPLGGGKWRGGVRYGGRWTVGALAREENKMKKSDIQIVNYKQFSVFDSRALLLKPTDLSPYVAFSILREWFGPPVPEVDEPKVQWHYYLFTPHLAIDVYDWKLYSLSIAVFERLPDYAQVEPEAKEFLELLRKQVTKHLGKIKSAASRARGFVYRNPFALYFNNAENILKRASQWRDEEMMKTSWELYRLAESGDLHRAAFFLYVASLEGLLNLIYEIYLNPALRDERIYNRLKREQVDIKLRLAPIYCTCFKHEVIDARSEEFRRFQFIVDLRNDFIHANITKPMRSSIVEEEGFVFWVDSEQSSKYGLPRDATELDQPHLEFVRKAILDMVEIIFDAMRPRYKREFSRVIYDEAINVDIDDGEFIII